MPPEVPRTVVLAFEGAVSPAEVRWMCEHVRYLLERTRASEVICDVSGVAGDGGVMEALSRMQLTARRLGARITLRHACEELRELLELSGLKEVLPCEELPLEPSGEAEQRE